MTAATPVPPPAEPGPPAPSQRGAHPLGNWPGETAPRRTLDDGAPVQQPVASAFIWGALYAFVIRSLCCAVSLTLIAPLSGPLTAPLRSVNADIGNALVLAEFLLLGLAAVAAMWVGSATRDGTRPALLRALFYGRVFLWGNVWYLAGIVLVAAYLLIWQNPSSGGAVLLLGCLNIPLLLWSRRIVTRTRWVTAQTG